MLRNIKRLTEKGDLLFVVDNMAGRYCFPIDVERTSGHVTKGATLTCLGMFEGKSSVKEGVHKISFHETEPWLKKYL